MLPNNRLDALLTARLASGRTPARAATAGTDDLPTQLVVADVLVLRQTATPPAAFANALETRLLAHAAMLARSDARSIAPIGSVRGSADRGTGIYSSPTRRWQRLRGPVRVVQAAAAVALLLLVLGGGVLVAAAGAGPGSPLFGLHRLEQDVRVNLSTDPIDRIRLHLAYATSDLAALDAALARPVSGPTYADALSAFRSDMESIAAELIAAAPGPQRDTLAGQFAALQAEGRADLLKGIQHLSWPDRLATTAVLGDLGAPIPVVANATIIRGVGAGPHGTRILIVGSGFQQGAVAEIDGIAAGQVSSLSTTQLVVQLDPTYPVEGAKTIGLSNPDGTSADTAAITSLIDAGNGAGLGTPGSPMPGATATDGEGKGHPGGGSRGTPTPSPTP